MAQCTRCGRRAWQQHAELSVAAPSAHTSRWRMKNVRSCLLRFVVSSCVQKGRCCLLNKRGGRSPHCMLEEPTYDSWQLAAVLASTPWP